MTSTKKPLFISSLPIMAGIFWGCVGIFVRVLDAAGLNNMTIVFSRAAVGVLITFLWILITDRRKLRIELRDLPLVLAMSLAGVVLLMIAYNYALTELTLSLAVILLCTAPIFVLLISAVVFKERIGLRKLICMVFAFIGCALLSGIAEGGSPIRWSVFGLLMGLASGAMNGVYMILSKGIARKGYSSLTISLYSFLFAALMLLPFVDWASLSAYIVASPLQSSVFLILQSVCSSLIPTITYITAMKYMDAGKAAILESGSEPAAALVLGILLYGEIPSLLGFAGLILTVVALSVLVSTPSEP